MFKPANELPKTLTRRQIIDFFEDYLMEQIEKYAKEGKTDIVLSAYSISVNTEIGQMCRGLHSRNDVSEFSWIWKNIEDYPEIKDDLKAAGYRVYTKPPYHTSIWCSWDR